MVFSGTHFTYSAPSVLVCQCIEVPVAAIQGTGILGVIPEDLHLGIIQFHFKRVVSKDSILNKPFYLNLPSLVLL